MIQVLRGTSNTIRAFIRDGSTVLTALTPVTIAVTGSNGAVTASSPVLDDTTGEWTSVLSSVAEVDQLTAVWTGTDTGSHQWTTTQPIEVVGAFYFDTDDLAQRPGIVNGNRTYSVEELTEGRQWIESRIEGLADTSFVERFHEDTLSHGEQRLDDAYARRLLAVIVDDVPLSSDDLALLTIANGWLEPRTTNVWPKALGSMVRWRETKVRYVAACADAPPADLRGAALDRAADYVTQTFGDSQIQNQITVDDDQTIRDWVQQVRVPVTA